MQQDTRAEMSPACTASPGAHATGEPGRGTGEAGLTGELLAEEVLAEEVLVEEVSIDGMCGVY
ncbi:MAG: mycofactocin precursor MftA [Streptosporangiaceae bacterium]